jgi:hypothetical protein
MKTHEMIRDIREGETYEIASGEFAGSGVALQEFGEFASKVLVWTEKDGLASDDARFTVNEGTLAYEWRKRTPAVTVDFAKAFAAYERGARITSQVTNETVSKTFYGNSAPFTADEIRGQWIVEGDGEYWWE